MDGYPQKSDSSTLIPLREVLPAVVDNVIKAAENETYIPGESTGFPRIDRQIMGLNPSHLIVLASSPQMGKTSLALNIAVNVAKQSRKTVAVFSPDMTTKDVAMRLLSADALVKHERLRHGEVDESDWEKIAQSCTDLTNTGIHIDDSRRLTVAGIYEKCQKVENLGLVVVDNLQSIVSADEQVHSEDSPYQRLSDITRRLKATANALKAPILCTSQLSRDFEKRVKKRDYKRPLLSDLRDSGTIEDDADIVMFLHRNSYYDDCFYDDDNPEKNITECIIAKNRGGELGVVTLRWVPEYLRFEPMETENGRERGVSPET